MERLDTDRSKHQNNLKNKLAERRKQKEEALKRKQESEMARELLEQRKEISETHSAAVSSLNYILVLPFPNFLLFNKPSLRTNIY